MTEAADTVPMSDEDIRVVDRPRCLMCSSAGDILYSGLHDRLYDVPGEWSLRLCRNPDCGLTWLDPAPIPSELWKIYKQYYTHESNEGRTNGLAWRALKKFYLILLYFSPLYYWRKRLFRMYLGRQRPGRLLEVGCGNGGRLVELRALGWQVVGQEVDSAAEASARKHGLDIRVGALESLDLPAGSFDAVICNHVIEHVPDPVKLLSDCYRLLNNAGIMVIVTPNTRSFGHRQFGRSWLALDPPRHLQLFTLTSIRQAALQAGIDHCRCWTSAVNAEIAAVGSYDIDAQERHHLGGPSPLHRRCKALLFQSWALVAFLFDAQSGDECVLWARKVTSLR
jgi:2-polyprenyl-3-methyl-5-hydroxy-6-metoxy-1,4-benzoquinol methylase